MGGTYHFFFFGLALKGLRKINNFLLRIGKHVLAINKGWEKS